MKVFVTKGRKLIPGKGYYSCSLVCLCVCICVSVAMCWVWGWFCMCPSLGWEFLDHWRELHLWVLAAPGTEPCPVQGLRQSL